MNHDKSASMKLKAKQIAAPEGASESDQQAVSRAVTMPSVGAALTIKSYTKRYGESATHVGLVGALKQQINTVQKGELNRVEAMLIVQAHSLDAIFNDLAQRAAANVGEYMNATDLYLRLALKAQNQCRATLETLAEIKFPKSPTFVRQQNVGVNQQVNNGLAELNIPRAHAREDSGNATNKLLEQDANGWQPIRMDIGTPRAASGDDCELEAVGVLDRPSEQGR